MIISWLCLPRRGQGEYYALSSSCYNPHPRVSEERWRSLKHTSEARERGLEELVEDLKTFRESGDQLRTWLGGKEKLLAILGPMATEPALVGSQLQQVALLEEEMGGQAGVYEQFISAGVAIADKCTPESRDADNINAQIEEVSGGGSQCVTGWHNFPLSGPCCGCQ
jgi:hypothetical protein